MHHHIKRFFNTLGNSYLFNEASTAKRQFHWSINIIVFIALVLGSMALGAFILKALAGVPKGQSLEDANIPGTLQLVGLFLPGWFALGLWVKLVEGRSILSVGFNRSGNAKRFAIGLFQGIALMSSIILTNWLLGGYELTAADQHFPTTAIATTIGLLLIGFIIQSGAEELWLRGWLMPVIGARYSKSAAIVIPVLIFVALHGMPDERPFYTSFSLLAFTLLVTLIALKQGSLTGVIGLHTGWNWSAGQLFGLNITNSSMGQESLLHFKVTGGVLISGGQGGPEWSLATLFILLLSLAWVVTNIYQNGIYKPEQDPKE